ncbi:hypothetical protein GCM10023149_26060 [Mucilaginibacter gynuensis]|uniref:AraC effector-binding domain-containing protein n=1 Tax=Mucilaginibacter gynuensis TaxID=1302236 RepID=A0ABP8GHE7_9SPHI
MQNRIETIAAKKLVGHKVTMSFNNDKTLQLWQGFMPRRRQITSTLSNDVFCMQIYEDNVIFTPDTTFEKWAVAEVSDFENIPEDMETYTLPGGLYAVFIYHGAASDFAPSFSYIFNEWLPVSGYVPDNRPHFEILGEKYKNNHPDSEEEVWIPIKARS